MYSLKETVEQSAQEMADSLSLEVLKKCLDVVLKHMILQGNIVSRWTVGLDVLGGLFQPW